MKHTLDNSSLFLEQIALSVICSTFPRNKINKVLSDLGIDIDCDNQLLLPPDFIIYSIIAASLLMNTRIQDILPKIKILRGFATAQDVEFYRPSQSTIWYMRNKIDSKIMKKIHDLMVFPLSNVKEFGQSHGAWYKQWHIVTLDSTYFKLKKSKINTIHYSVDTSKQILNDAQLPLKLHFTSIIEQGTQVLFGSVMHDVNSEQISTFIFDNMKAFLQKDMLCIIPDERLICDFWLNAKERQYELICNIPSHGRYPCIQNLKDGSYIGLVKTMNHGRNVIQEFPARIVRYFNDPSKKSKTKTYLMTTIFDPNHLSSREIASIYLKHPQILNSLSCLRDFSNEDYTLRSRLPHLVEQEFYGQLMAQFTIRKLFFDTFIKDSELIDCDNHDDYNIKLSSEKPPQI